MKLPKKIVKAQLERGELVAYRLLSQVILGWARVHNFTIEMDGGLVSYDLSIRSIDASLLNHEADPDPFATAERLSIFWAEEATRLSKGSK